MFRFVATLQYHHQWMRLSSLEAEELEQTHDIVGEV